MKFPAVKSFKFWIIYLISRNRPWITIDITRQNKDHFQVLTTVFIFHFDGSAQSEKCPNTQFFPVRISRVVWSGFLWIIQGFLLVTCNTSIVNNLFVTESFKFIITLALLNETLNTWYAVGSCIKELPMIRFLSLWLQKCLDKYRRDVPKVNPIEVNVVFIFLGPQWIFIDTFSEYVFTGQNMVMLFLQFHHSYT